jgi:hypothetical protein
LHFDVVAVSGANEYSVKPLALVSTVTPPMVAVFRAVPDELTLGEAAAEAAADGLLELCGVAVDELPHAAAISATATSPKGAHIIFLRIGRLRSKRKFTRYPWYVTPSGFAWRGPETLQATVKIGQRRLPLRYIGPAWAAAAQVP